MARKSLYFAVFSALVLTAACSTVDKKDKDTAQFVIRTALPATYELEGGKYPADTCLPMQIQALKKGTTEGIALRKAQDIALRVAEMSDQMEFAFYSTAVCSDKIAKATLPASDLKPSMVKIFVQARGEGQINYRIEYGGTGWGMTAVGSLEFI